MKVFKEKLDTLTFKSLTIGYGHIHLKISEQSANIQLKNYLYSL